MIPVAQALQHILSLPFALSIETVPLMNSIGKVLAEDLLADRDYPPFHRAAMDGVALRANDLEQFSSFPILETIFAGATPTISVTEGKCSKIMTGASLPEGADAIIRIEDCEIKENIAHIKIKGLKPWNNISKKGEDASQGLCLLKSGTLISPQVIGLIATLGKANVQVYTPPAVSILSTGDELRWPHESVEPHQIRECNGHALEAFLHTYQIVPRHRLIVPDHKEKLREAIRPGLTSKVLILSGGVSAGEADFVPEILTELGVKKIFHKVALKPGKPIWLGQSASGTIVFGLPGNPMSCQVAFNLFIEPWIRQSLQLPPRPVFHLPLSEGRNKKGTLEEYFPCKIIYSAEGSFLQPVSYNGSGDITATLHSDGLARHEAQIPSLRANERVDFRPW